MDNHSLETPSSLIPSSQQPFYSCEWIEGGLAFAHDSLHICCEPQGWCVIDEFHGGEIPEERIRLAREKIKAEIAANPMHICHSCHKLIFRTWEKKKHLVDIINLSHFYVCNLKCKYCYLQLKHIDAVHDKPYDIYPILQAMLQHANIAAGVKVYWGGGEPTLLKNFDQIIEILAKLKAYHTFNTNSILFSPLLYHHLKESDRFFLTTSIDAGTPETYKTIKGVDGFERALANLSKYAEAGGERVAYKIIFTDENSNEREIEHIIEICKSNHIRKIAVDIDYNSPVQGENIIEAMASIIDLAMENDISIGVMANPLITRRMNEHLALHYEEKVEEILEPANQAFLRGDMDEAIADFTRVTQVMPELASGFTGLGVALLKKNRPADAAPVLLQAAKLAPKNADIFNLLGNTLYQLHDLAGAEASFKAALKIDDTHPGALFNLIDVLQAEGQQEEARTVALYASRTYPQNARLKKMLDENRSN